MSQSVIKDTLIHELRHFKYGEYEGERNGRFFLDLIEERFRQYVSKTNFEILELCVTQDVRPEKLEKWLNVVMKK